MTPIQFGHITNADVYIDGNRLVGRVKEFEIPEHGYKMVEHEALGSIGVLELPSRAMEALKGKVVFEYLDQSVERLVLNPTRVIRWQLHSYVDVFGADGLDRSLSHKLITSLSVMLAKSNALGHTLGEAVNRELEVTITAMVQKTSNHDVPVFEYDIFNGIHRVNGEDVWPV